MLRQKKGQTTVEFALVVLLFLTLIMTIVDFALMFFVNQTIQHAVREGARYAVTGRNEGGLDPSCFHGSQNQATVDGVL